MDKTRHRIRPCSMYVTASFKRSAKCNLTRTVANRRLRKTPMQQIKHLEIASCKARFDQRSLLQASTYSY